MPQLFFIFVLVQLLLHYGLTKGTYDMLIVHPIQAMESYSTKKFLIDGFPRNEDNLAGWEKQMEDKAEIKFVLFFNCPEEVIVV